MIVRVRSHRTVQHSMEQCASGGDALRGRHRQRAVSGEQ